jgi:hypothetical protein
MNLDTGWMDRESRRGDCDCRPGHPIPDSLPGRAVRHCRTKAAPSVFPDGQADSRFAGGHRQLPSVDSASGGLFVRAVKGTKPGTEKPRRFSVAGFSVFRRIFRFGSLKSHGKARHGRADVPPAVAHVGDAEAIIEVIGVDSGEEFEPYPLPGSHRTIRRAVQFHPIAVCRPEEEAAKIEAEIVLDAAFY